MTKNDTHLLEWPAGGLTRAPFRVMSDPEIYAEEQQRIFRGPVWNYLCLEAEIADPGSYRTVYIGDTPVIAARDQDGSIHAMVNRCAHKGALLCPEAGDDEELGRLRIRREDIAAYVEELEQSLREWHHGFSEGDLEKARECIFGAKA